SALGLAVAALRRDYVRPYLSPLAEADPERMEELFARMETEAKEHLAAQGEPRSERRADLRYAGQSFELTVEASGAQDLAGRFHDAHERRYGYRMDSEPVELVNLRLVANVPVQKPPPESSSPPGETRSDLRAESREARFAKDWLRSKVVQGLPQTGAITGPAVLEFPESTCLIPPGWGGEVDGAGALVLRRLGDG
ncbi:MAG: hydantoinase/oxoprolinase family protein, partial [Rubrobacter sp.]|nr:hydantoinase/oxoprolinase family protein [Rubrobacter sp.]